VPPTAIATFERFFRAASSLDIDKNDIKRFDDFVHGKLYDLLLIGEAHAKANARDIMEPWDLPITKGLQESIHRFRTLDTDVGLGPVLERLATYPPLGAVPSEETEARLPEVLGGLSLALARSFKIIEPDLPNPQTVHWERAHGLFDLLL
jgi:hypothetical protein